MNMRKELGFGRRLKPIQGQYNIVRVVSDVRYLHVRFPVGNEVDAGTDVAVSHNFPNFILFRQVLITTLHTERYHRPPEG